MEKVQELYVKYNLDRLGERRESKLVYLIIPTKRKRIERYHFLICSILNEHFFVQVIHSSQYDAKDLCDYKVIELLGTQENVLMAEYVYYFLRQQVHTLWERYRSSARKSARAKSSYILGVLSGFRDKLDSHRAQKVEPRKKKRRKPRGGHWLPARTKSWRVLSRTAIRASKISVGGDDCMMRTRSTPGKKTGGVWFCIRR